MKQGVHDRIQALGKQLFLAYMFSFFGSKNVQCATLYRCGGFKCFTIATEW